MVLPGDRHAPHAKAGLGGVEPRDELGGVAGVGPHHGAVVAHVGGGQGEERLARLVRRNGRHVSGTGAEAEARLGRLRLPALVGGTGVGAAVAAVRVGSDQAGVGVVRTVCGASLVSIRLLLWVEVVVVVVIVVMVAAGGGGAASLSCCLATGGVAV